MLWVCYQIEVAIVFFFFIIAFSSLTTYLIKNLFSLILFIYLFKIYVFKKFGFDVDNF